MNAMQDKAGDDISAWVDGELGGSEARFLRRRLDNDPAERARLQRYHTQSAAMRREYVPAADGLADRVRAAIDAEPAHASGPRPEPSDAARSGLPAWLQPVAGVAIAASVALGLVTVLPMLGGPGNDASTASEMAVNTVQTGSATGTLETVSTGSASGPAAAPAVVTLDAEARRRVNAYFVNHSEHAAGGQLGATLKYARIVGHGSER